MSEEGVYLTTGGLQKFRNFRQYFLQNYWNYLRFLYDRLLTELRPIANLIVYKYIKNNFWSSIKLTIAWRLYLCLNANKRIWTEALYPPIVTGEVSVSLLGCFTLIE